jgi:outer membrane protein assembly factor BamB
MFMGGASAGRRAGPIVSVIVGLVAALPAAGENWPGWRGPRGDGTSTETQVPVRWDAATGENIRWQIDVPGDGHSSPVIWGDRVFLTSCLPETEERVLFCLHRDDGRTLWKQTVVRAPLETLHQLNSRASGTPATDGELIFVTFLETDGSLVDAPNVGTPRQITPGQMLVAAYDFDGHQVWVQRVGEFISAHGFSTCPVLYENLVILNGDHDGQGYLVALDRETGETVWKSPRAHGIRSYVTPIIREAGGRTQLVMSGSLHVAAFNPLDGASLWTHEGPTEQFVASPVFDGERFIFVGGFPDYHVLALRGDGAGDITQTHVAWHSTEARCYVPSPVLVDGRLMVANDEGIAHCFDASTGEHLWKTRLGRHYSASLLSANGRAYFLDDDGITKVVRSADTLEVEAENPVGEFCCSSPAIADGALYIRSETHLFCIAE